MAELIDLDKFRDLIRTVENQMADVKSTIEKVKSRLPIHELDMSSGISFLEVKNHLLLSYLQSVTYLMLRKMSGESLQNVPALLRIVEIRTVLERMRPMEQKLKYHIDKIIKSGAGEFGADNPLRFKPNPDALLDSNKNDDEEVSNESDDGGSAAGDLKESGKKNGIYAPPRLAPVPYDLDENPKDRTQKHADRAKKRAMHSSIMQELRREYYDEPEEIHDSDIYRMKSDKRAKDIERYEEQNMTRLNVSKKDQARSRKMATMNSLSHLADFGDFRGFTGDGNDDGLPTEKRSKKRKAPQRKGKKFKKQRKHH